MSDSFEHTLNYESEVVELPEGAFYRFFNGTDSVIKIEVFARDDLTGHVLYLEKVAEYLRTVRKENPDAITFAHPD